MKRFGREKFPEQYPAVLDEWAEPVDGDSAEVAAVRGLLKNTNLEFRKLKLTYSGNRDGWNPSTFHQKVDKLGGALVVCTTQDGLICGGCKLITTKPFARVYCRILFMCGGVFSITQFLTYDSCLIGMPLLLCACFGNTTTMDFTAIMQPDFTVWETVRQSQGLGRIR